MKIGSRALESIFDFEKTNDRRGALRMKLVSFKLMKNSGDYKIGCFVNDRVIDIQQAHKKYLMDKEKVTLLNGEDKLLPSDPSQFFSLGIPAIQQAKKACDHVLNSKVEDVGFIFDHEAITLSTPIPNPSKIICVGQNYAEHVSEMASDIPKFPVLFAKFSNALIGPEDAIEKPAITNRLDYEVELAIVIGKEAANISKEEAYDYIAGYTIANDTSARDLQKQTPQWLQGKTLDRSTPVGPWVVTSDEVGDAANLSIRSYVNGEERQASHTSHFIFDIPFLLEYISKIMTLEPGDIILTGTPDGVGFAMSPPRFLEEGDQVTLEIEKIGRMENVVKNRSSSGK
ncbi:MAG TPA: fumarylacetoacetate hydrolase family protein [Bacillota bacterium]|nr:fumarylacetoacetate hydrolase family protein [Bacillota bacterium]